MARLPHETLCREAKGTCWPCPLLHAFRGPREAVSKCCVPAPLTCVSVWPCWTCTDKGPCDSAGHPQATLSPQTRRKNDAWGDSRPFSLMQKSLPRLVVNVESPLPHAQPGTAPSISDAALAGRARPAAYVLGNQCYCFGLKQQRTALDDSIFLKALPRKCTQSETQTRRGLAAMYRAPLPEDAGRG